MADTASLVVRVTAQGLQKTEKELQKFKKTSKQAEDGTMSLMQSLKGSLSVATAAATSYLAVSGAITAMVVSSAKAERETKNLARTAKTSKADFEALSFAFRQYGVDAKGVADAMNDVSERLGEFAAAASGPFQDFADVMGLTKAEAVAMASELQKLKPEDAIARMVKEMEAAGVQGAQMSFVMKSMSNDLEYASEAFADNSAKLKALKSDYSEANKELQLTTQQTAALGDASTSYDLMTSSLSKAATAISATLAPATAEFFNDVIRVVPEATKAIIEFVNAFQDPENINSIKDVDTQIQSLQDSVENLKAKTKDFRVTDQGDAEELRLYNQLIKENEERLQGLYHQRLELQKQQQAAEKGTSKVDQSVQFGGGTGSGTGKEAAKQAEAAKKQAQAYLDQLAQANMSELELISAHEQQKIDKLKEFRDQKLISEQAYQDALTEIETTAVLARAEYSNKILDEQAKRRDEARKGELELAAKEREINEKRIDDGISAQRSMTQNLRGALGEQSSLYKASAIITTTIDTYKAAMAAYSSLAGIPVVGPALGAAAAGAAIAFGGAQISAIRGAREQGGSMIGGSPYQMAERGQAEVIVPSGNSRARTAQQMRQIMGENNTSQASNVTIVNNTTASIDSVQTEQRDDGQLVITVEEIVADALANPDSRVAKARRATTGQAGF